MSEWRRCKLGDISIYVNRGISPKYVETFGIPVINQKCIKNGVISKDFLKYHNKEKQYTKEKQLNKFDILINSTGLGTAGRVGLFFDDECFLADSHVSIVRIDERYAYSKFIFYNLRNREEEIETYAEGSTGQAELSRERIRELDIFLPPLPEQKAIAAVLSSLDDKIDLLHRQNKTLEAMAEALFKQWFVVEAREDWVEKSLLDVIELVGGGTPKTTISEYWNGEISWLSGGDIASSHKSFAISSKKSITQEGLNKSAAKLLPKYATVISARGTVGKYALLSKPMTYSQSNYGILPKINNCFFFTYLLINNVVSELQTSVYGSVFDTITTETFKNISVSVPTEEIIKNFEKRISSYFFKKLHCLVQIQTLETLRDTLLPKLMSGQVRLTSP